MSLTCDKVVGDSRSCGSRVSSHWSKRLWSCWRSASHCLLARTSVKEITSAHPMGESSQMGLERACTHYREVTYGMSESPNAPLGTHPEVAPAVLVVIREDIRDRHLILCPDDG